MFVVRSKMPTLFVINEDFPKTTSYIYIYFSFHFQTNHRVPRNFLPCSMNETLLGITSIAMNTFCCVPTATQPHTTHTANTVTRKLHK